MITIVTPISQSKSYCFYDYARGILELDYPKEEIYIVFIVDTNGDTNVSNKIDVFSSMHWPHPQNCFVIPTFIEGNNPVNSDAVDWKKRAQIAARMRNIGIKFVRSNLLDTSHIFSLGSDIIVEPDTLNRLLESKEDLISALYMSRCRHQPLALSFDYDSHAWEYMNVDLDSNELLQADWSGMDCLLISQKVFRDIDFDEYSLDKYGVGEDGYFFIESKLRTNSQLWIDMGIRPLHVHSDGKPVCAKPITRFGIQIVCSFCGWTTVMEKTYKDVEVGCGKCQKIFPADPYWKHRIIDESIKLTNSRSII